LEDIYNIDEKGVIIGQIREEKVIITINIRANKKSFITQDKSRE